MSSAERRITVQASIYPKLKEWAERDNLTVADVANAILLQTIRPYGAVPLASKPLTEVDKPSIAIPDPYQTAAIESW